MGRPVHLECLIGWNDRFWRKAAIPNVGCVGMAEDGICRSKGHQRGAGERWITWDFENRSHRATRDAARARRRGRPAKGTRATAASKAQSALDAARRKHEKNAADIQAQIEALEERSRAEIAHWEKEKARLEAALRRARGG